WLPGTCAFNPLRSFAGSSPGPDPGAVGVVPGPGSGTSCGLPAAFDVTLSRPDLAPLGPGVTVTSPEPGPAAPTEFPAQGSAVIANIVVSGPPSATSPSPKTRFPSPVLVTVTVRGDDVVATC